MRQRIDGTTAVLGITLLVGSLLACKKSQDQAPQPIASATQSAPSAPPPVVDAGPPPLQRYGTEEKEAKGKARVVVDELAVYPKADIQAESLAKLVKETEVERKARYQNFTLVEYPDSTKPNEHLLGWVEDKQDPKNPVLKDVVVAVARQPVKPPPPSTSAGRGRSARSRPSNMR